MKDWIKETFTPYQVSNQYGTFQSTKRLGEPTISFFDWLKNKYKPIKVEECGY
jgi:hypothetical protein